jgi:tRNA(Ile)-lysidine synthase
VCKIASVCALHRAFPHSVHADILGGVAQSVRACGSYPQCPGFKSLHRHLLLALLELCALSDWEVRMLVAEVRACIEAHAMLPLGAKVVVAVSGGADSMALLFALFQLRSIYNMTLIVAHVNHQLREEEAGQDALFVEQQAARLGLPFHQTCVDVKALQQSSGISVQQAARHLRYRFLYALHQALNVTRIALGHTADDQAETLLMRLVRGSGPAGFAGIPVVRLPFIRPLITVARPAIYSYLQSEHCPWVDDSSNARMIYLRNRVRLDLLPKLQQYNPRIVRRLNELADMLRADSQVLEQQVDEWALQTLAWQARSRVEIYCRLFGLAPIAIQRRLLRRVIEALAASPEAVGFRHLERLRQFIISGKQGRRCSLPGEIGTERRAETILLWNASRYPAVPCILALPVPGKVDIIPLNIRLTADVLPKPCQLGRMSPQWALLDLDRIVCPLQVRFRQSGDRFYPLGAPGSKKLQDFFVDARIPRGERQYVPLVVSNREIVWVVGHRIAEPFKLRPETNRVLRLQCCALQEASS